MAVFTDQTGRTITLEWTPKRIVSLVPSQTELLYDLGLDNAVAGITKFCVHPEAWFRTKTRVGGTKQVKPGIIHQLKPDLILANKEENVREQVDELSRQYPVWVSDVNDLASAYGMMEEVGKMTGKTGEARRIIRDVQDGFSRLKDSLDSGKPKPRTVYLLWQEPFMTAGGDTFIHAMLEAAGLENMFAGHTRYPVLSLSALRDCQPQLLLLSSEPFPFTQKHADWLQPQLPGTKILLADGEMFSWYGSRMLKAPGYFFRLREMINGEI